MLTCLALSPVPLHLQGVIEAKSFVSEQLILMNAFPLKAMLNSITNASML